MATANVRVGIPHEEADRVRTFADLRQRQAHMRLQNDIIEELWMRMGAR